MLHVLFIILKIIGILVLIILGLILAVLVMPLFYRFSINKEEKKELHAQVAASWFFHILYFKGVYIDQKFLYQVRLFGFMVMGNEESFLKKMEEKEKRKQEKEQQKQQKELAKEEETAPEISTKEVEEDKIAPMEIEVEEDRNAPMEIEVEEERNAPAETVAEAEEERTTSTETETETETKTEVKRIAPAETKAKKKKFGFGKKKNKSKKKNKTEKQPVTKKIDGIKDKLSSLKTQYEEYHGHELLILCKDSIIKLLKHVLPRRLTGNITYGFEDPAYTGYVTAFAALFYGKYHKHLFIHPDFGEKCFAADCKGKGHIQIIFFLYMACSLLLKEDVRNLIKIIRK